MTGVMRRVATLAAVAVIGLIPSAASADPWKDEIRRLTQEWSLEPRPLVTCRHDEGHLCARKHLGYRHHRAIRQADVEKSHVRLVLGKELWTDQPSAARAPASSSTGRGPPGHG